MSDVKDIGARIRTARNLRGLSETALARAAGVTRWRVRSLETGEHVVGVDAAARIIAALGMSADVALFGPLRSQRDRPTVPAPAGDVVATFEGDGVRCDACACTPGAENYVVTIDGTSACWRCLLDSGLDHPSVLALRERADQDARAARTGGVL